MAGYVRMCDSEVEIKMLKWLKRMWSIVQNVYHNSYSLQTKICCAEFNFMFKDMSVCPVGLFTSKEWTHSSVLFHICDITSHNIFFFVEDSMKMAEKAESCRTTICLYMTLIILVIGICRYQCMFVMTALQTSPSACIVLSILKGLVGR
jgi:hypothetical protein